MNFSLTFPFLGPINPPLSPFSKGGKQKIYLNSDVLPDPSLTKRGMFSPLFKGKRKIYLNVNVLIDPTLAKGGMGGFGLIS